MIKKYLIPVIASIALCFAGSFAASAQTALSEFNTIDVENDFEVTLVKGSYAIALTVDSAMDPYIRAYVKGKTLYIGVDEKAVPKDVKKMYKGKNAPEKILRAVVYAPQINEISLKNNSTLIGTEEFATDRFTLFVGDKAMLKSLNVYSTQANITMKKNGSAIMALRSSGDVQVESSNNSNLQINGLECKDLKITTGNSAQIATSGNSHTVAVVSDGSSTTSITTNTETVYITASGSSKVNVTGTASLLSVKGSRSSVVDTINLPVNDAECEMNNGTLNLAVAKKLSVNLSNGAEVYYSGQPEIILKDKIVKSTLAPYQAK